MLHGFHLEIRRLVLLSIVCLGIGLISGHVLLALFAGSCVYIIRTLQHLHTFDRWLRQQKLSTIPDASGVWGEIFDNLSRQKKRQQREKKRLKAVILRVETMTAALNDAVILLDADKSINWMNEASRQLLQLKKSDNGRPIKNFIRNPLFIQYLDEGNYEIPLVLPTGPNLEQRLEFRINHFGEGEGLLIVRNITRLYRLEQMRKDFVANVSHELRTPLTVLRGYLETLGDSEQINSRWNKPIEQMQQQAVRMTTLINDLTMLSKLETEDTQKRPEPIKLKPLLQMVCNEAKSISADKQHIIELDCDDTISVMGNDRELHSAFSNLVLNAVKYSQPKKTIHVSVAITSYGGLEVKVKDQGIGIEQHHIYRLTERFYRVDASRSIETGGTGLGLAIVKHVLARHDAELKISSQVHQGSTFIAAFPEVRLVTNEASDE